MQERCECRDPAPRDRPAATPHPRGPRQTCSAPRVVHSIAIDAVVDVDSEEYHSTKG